MKLNISYPANGSQKLIDIEDERKLRDFMEKRVRFYFPTSTSIQRITHMGMYELTLFFFSFIFPTTDGPGSPR